MTLDELLGHEVLQLPKSWSKDRYGSYQAGISGYGHRYLDILKGVNDVELSGTIPFIGDVNKEILIQVATVTLHTV
ncbi:hypothetical protein [Roseivirga seohaensis]|uniref:hypothetical protein n=1 Tax=Roseivirga seohaensis TaxID=1914963 RepID=UPI0009E90A77|nr:hypothetical protein [Roseivirga seohaensis]